MRQFTPHQPQDAYGEEFGNTLCSVSLARSVNTVTSSTYIAFNPDSRWIRVFAVSKDVFLKWAYSDTDYCNAQNFDEMIVAGEAYLDLKIPVQETGSSVGALFTGVQLVGRESGASAVVIEK